jgi:hypothetical protein
LKRLAGFERYGLKETSYQYSISTFYPTYHTARYRKPAVLNSLIFCLIGIFYL